MMTTVHQFRTALAAISGTLAGQRPRHSVVPQSDLQVAAKRLAKPVIRIKRRIIQELRQSVGSERSLMEGGAAPDVLHAAGIERNEVIHTRLLGWLLDPQHTGKAGTHLLVELLYFSKHVAAGITRKQFWKLVRGGVKLVVESVGEEGRPDLEIQGKDFLVFIENKLDSGQQYTQLRRYRKRASSTRRALGIPRSNVFLLYLTLVQDDKPERATGFSHITYGDVAKALEKAIRHTERSSDSPKKLMEQYLSAIQKLRLRQEHLTEALERVRVRPESVASLSLWSLKKLSEWRAAE